MGAHFRDLSHHYIDICSGDLLESLVVGRKGVGGYSLASFALCRTAWGWGSSRCLFGLWHHGLLIYP